ncbi:MAG: sugar transferase [Bryobacteraceae bacterium]
MIRLFKVSVPSSTLALIFSETILLFSCFVLAAYWTVEAPDLYLLDDGGIASIALMSGIILLGLYFADLYENYRIPSRTELIQQFCMAIGAAFLVQAMLNYGRWNSLVLPKWMMLYGSALALVVLPAWRILFSSVVWRALPARKILMIGSSPVAREVVRGIFERHELGLAVIGFLDSAADGPEKLSGAPRLGAIADLDGVVTVRRPDAIVVGLTERRGNLPVERLLDLRLSGIHVEEAALTYEAVFGRVSTRDLRPSQLVFSAELGPRRSSLTLQPLYSVPLSLAGLTIALPAMAIVAALVKVTSSGPVLFRQERVGLKGEVFTVYKFRSMYNNAEAGTGAVWAAKDDPRVTPLGRWLRQLRLDELPQLFNVLRGEMAIVGPRPERPEFVSVLQEQIPYYRQRHCVKPGITGWAQINHKYGDTVEDTITKLEYDLYYIKHMALSLDLYIIFHTVKTMLFGRGAQ